MGLDNHVWNNDGDKAYMIHYDDWGVWIQKGLNNAWGVHDVYKKREAKYGFTII